VRVFQSIERGPLIVRVTVDFQNHRKSKVDDATEITVIAEIVIDFIE